MKQIDSLTGLRFFAAMAIVAWHSQTGYFFKAGAFAPFYLAGAVPLFFALSGFVLTINADPNRSWRDFFAARIARVWPAHFAAIVFLFAIFYPYSIETLHDPSSVKNLILNGLLLQAWSPNMLTYWSVNAPSWSVSCELFFYAVFPIALSLSSARPARSLVVVVASTTAAIFAIGFIFPKVDANWLGSVNPVACFTGFACGIAAGVWYKRALPTRAGFPIATVMQLGALVLAICANAIFENHTPAALPGGILAYVGLFGPTPFYALLLVALARYDGAVSRFLSYRVIVYGGEISYSLYLFHQLIIRWHFAHLAELSKVPMWCQYIGVLAVSFITAAVVHHAVEKPGRKYIMAGWRRLFAQPAPVSQPS